MRQLILFRHAKSSWADPELEDFDRPLNQRGRMAAPLMGAWLADRGLRPDLAVLSTSARTRETWERARAAFRDPPPCEALDRLYHAAPDVLLDVVRGVAETVSTLAVIGHQPGIGAFCRKLSRPDPPAHCARAFTKFPTAAVAVLDFSADAWGEVGFGQGDFHSFAVPRELV